MSEFLVSARKYRPTTFDDVVGQSSVTSTLKNAIQSNQLAQSYLFCGPRGIGKTTCARIFAKEINLFQNTDQIDDFSYNIFELDAASNNSVDDIRNLTDQVRVPPQIGKYKVYIIDEVHMLSQAAFNAFLKTLEEPPSHAKFILATTEKHKIIPTILSRCQIFDFKRVSNDDIVKNLKFVAQSENIKIEDEALFLIAEKSDGALRDSLSLFDRLVSFSDNSITYKDVADHLNVLDYEYFFKITDQLLKNDISSLLVTFNDIINNGFDGQHFINGLSEHLRKLLLCQNQSTVNLLSVNESLKSKYLNQANNTDSNFLIEALNLTNTCDLQYKLSTNKRLLVEICLMQVSSINFLEQSKKKNKNFVVSSKNDTTSDSEPTIKKNNEPSEEKQTEKEKKESVIELEEVNPIPSSKTISILGSLKDEQEIEDKIEISKNLDYFSDDDLQARWKEMNSNFSNQGKTNLVLALNSNKPVLKENYIVEVTLSNTSQVELLNEEKLNILAYLREKMNNDSIDIITNVIQSDKNDTPYTNSDKYKKMYEQNKNLAILGQKLGLDPDY
ncbi:MAG: DNA polymerase III subunit gamma/tau [Flavobacteriales bacterium]